MKKQLFICGFAALLFTACSSDESEELFNAIVEQADETESEDEELMAETVVGDSDVPITFDFERTATRGSISTDPFSCDSVGVFCFARQPIEDNSYEASWNKVGSANIQKARRWIDNAMVNIMAAGASGDDAGGVMVWNDGYDHFYPSLESSFKYAYTFMAYHPWTDSVYYVKNTIYIILKNLDGHQDVVTSVAASPVDGNGTGFSAQYYRKEGGTALPHFDFKHRMSKLNFQIKLKSGTDATRGFFVDSVWIPKLPNVMRVRLANLGAGGTVEEPTMVTIFPRMTTDAGTVETLGNYWLREKDNSSIRKNEYTFRYANQFLPVGDGIMIPPMQESLMDGTAADRKRYYTTYATLTVYIRLKDADEGIYEFKATVAPPTDGWQQGKQYPVKIVVSPPEIPTNVPLAATARIAEWSLDGSDDRPADYESVVTNS